MYKCILIDFKYASNKVVHIIKLLSKIDIYYKKTSKNLKSYSAEWVEVTWRSVKVTRVSWELNHEVKLEWDKILLDEVKHNRL